MKGASIEEGDANQNMDEVEDVNAEEDTNEKRMKTRCPDLIVSMTLMERVTGMKSLLCAQRI